MDRILIQIRGSANDPEYAVQNVVVRSGEESRGVPFLEFFHRQGIKTLEKDLVTSCHGCTEISLTNAGQINDLAKENRVAVVAKGGLYFALTGILAANAPTVPMISLPLDAGWYGGLDAFLAGQLPSGTAAVGCVGVNNYQAAANVTAGILKNEFEGVYTYKASQRLIEALEDFKVPILGDYREQTESGLVVGSPECSPLEFHSFDANCAVGVFTPRKSGSPEDAIKLMDYCSNLERSVWVRGEDNVAAMAAKIMAQYNPDIVSSLKEAASRKAHDYGIINLKDSLTIGR